MHSLIQTFLATWALGALAAASKVRNNQLFGNTTLGYYYIEVFVGSQQSPQTLIVDTGSYSIIFPCEDCQKCGKHINPYFNSTASSTFSLINPNETYYDWKCFYPTTREQCDFFEGYVEGSGYTGIYGVDSIVFKTELDSTSDIEKKAIFGCATEETHEFYKQSANGIMGLAPESRGFSKPPTIIQIERMEGRITQDSFSLCLGRNGGQIGLGGGNNITHVSEKSVTLSSSNLSWDDFYYVNLDGMKVGGQTVKYDFKAARDPQGTAFLDSGTTFVYFGEALYSQYRKQFVRFCGKLDTNCGAFIHPNNCHIFPNEMFDNLRDFYDSFPVLELIFDNDKPVSWFPEDYLYKADDTHYYCVGIEPLRDVILGAIFVKNYDVLVNKENKTVTFTRANCSQIRDQIPFISTGRITR
jgi:hypothetical protein